MLSRTPNIAIDGPAGSGKSTVAREVARKLGFLYVDTGAMYRAVTYLALRESVDLCNSDSLTAFTGRMKFSLVRYLKAGDVFLWCNGENLTPFLRGWDVSQEVARVAAVAGVRRHLVRYQRLFARSGGVVMEGRDIGTVVLPDTPYKFFLTADFEVRLARREQELQAQGQTFQRDDLRKEFLFRDDMDRRRVVGPLQVAPGARVLDCTRLTAAEVVQEILATCGGN